MTRLRSLFLAATAFLAQAASVSAQEGGVPVDDAMDPWIGYALAVAIAGAGVFLVCKSARRS